MIFFIKNNTLSVQIWNGKQFQVGEYRELDRQTQEAFLDNPKVLVALAAGDAVVAASNDGLSDFAPEDGLNRLDTSVQGNSDINLAITGENGLYFTQVISSIYTTVACIPYRGRNNEGPIKKVQIVARLQPTGEFGSARLFDSDNQITFAEGIDIIDDTAKPFRVYDLGPVSNLPLRPQLIKLQVKSNGGVKKFKIGYVRLKK